MDSLDTRILRELTQAQTTWPARPGLVASYRDIGRRVGVSHGTVRNRILKLVRSGFLQGVNVYANPNVLGLLSGSYGIAIPSGRSKLGVIDRLRRVPGLVFFENFRGPLLGIGLAYDDDPGLERLLSRIDRIAGSGRGNFTRVRHPPLNGSVDPVEWKLVARLMTGGFRSYQNLAGELGISVRTLKRRLAHLVRVGAVLTFPRMDFRALQGGVVAELLVVFRDTGSKAESEIKIRHRLEDWLFFAGEWEEFGIYRLILPNVSMTSDLEREIRRIAGVRRVQAELVDSLVDHLAALLPYVEARVIRAGVKRPVVSLAGSRERIHRGSGSPPANFSPIEPGARRRFS